MNFPRTCLLFAPILLLSSCGGSSADDGGQSGDVVEEGAPPMRDPDPGKADQPNQLNLAAGSMVLYEVQVRAANACRNDTGSAAQKKACKAKVSPTITYRAEGMTCNILDDLQAIRFGTLDDMLDTTNDYRQGITLRYIQEKVGANTVWLMPVFPNNDQWNIPDACDNVGSPYAVRDYFHPAGTLARRCIVTGKDEYSKTPCWAGPELDALIADAHGKGLKVMLDVALNHFGHNYLMYDYSAFTSIRERIARGEDLNKLWNFQSTYEAALLHPEILDTPEKLSDAAGKDSVVLDNLDSLRKRCPDLQGDQLVRSFGMWRNALDWERAKFPCGPSFLESAVPGFYLGSNSFDPSTGPNDTFTNDWRDVKFIYHHETNSAHQHEFVRQREYLFRMLNYWVSRGVDGFRLDHTTDFNGGMAPNEWKYLLSKVDHYAWKRGQALPVYLAEEFGNQQGMNNVVDVMTEGYVGDMAHAVNKNTSHIESVLDNMRRFNGHAFVMTALETHDEKRLLDGNGFNIWTGAGFWGIGAATRSTPMILMGQEFGEPYGLGFRRSDFLRSRFEGTSNYNPQGGELAAYYRSMIASRLAPENRSLIQPYYRFLRTKTDNAVDQRILAMVKWSNDGNVVFVFHNLWEQDVAQSYRIDADLGRTLAIDGSRSYKLVNVFTGQQMGACQTGAALQDNFYVSMAAGTRAQWLRLQTCP